MKTVKFLQDKEVQDQHAGTKKATVFKKDQMVELEDASADHWINRGAAVEVSAEEMQEAAHSKKAAPAEPAKQEPAKKA